MQEPPVSPEPALPAAIAKVALALRHHAVGQSAERDLSPTQAQILSTLAGHSGGRTVGELADALGLTLPTVSESISALSQRGLVRKVRADDDRRRISVTLTARGRSQSRGLRLWPDALLEASEALDEGEKAVLVRTLVKLIRALQDRGEIPTSRMCVSCVHFRPHVHADRARPHHCAFVDAPFGDAALRVECLDHVEVAPEGREVLWQVFVNGAPVKGD